MEYPVSPAIRQLATLIRTRREAGVRPYTVLLGSSLSLTPEIRRAVCGSDDWGAFWTAMQRLSQAERRALLASRFSALKLTAGYSCLAQLVRAGYFDLVFTLNVDDELDNALRILPPGECHISIHGQVPGIEIASALGRTHPRVKVVKLGGDINTYNLPITPEGRFEFPDRLRETVERLLSEDTILVGDISYDTDIQRCIRKGGGALWVVVPEPPKVGSFLDQAKQARPKSELITGTEAEFVSFFSALARELEVEFSQFEQGLRKIEIIDIPFVIMAMTHDEATRLIKGTVFDHPAVAPDERTQFRQFREALKEHDIEDLLLHYEERREDWKPFVCQQSGSTDSSARCRQDEAAAIDKIIYKMVDHINQCRREMPGLPLIRPEFLSADFFEEEDHDKRLQIWEQLGLSGCVLIADAVSLFHPGLRQMLLQSAVSSNERVAMLVLSPVSSSIIRANELIEQAIRSQMQLAFLRFEKHLDKLCEFGVGDLRALQRWLFAILPETATILQNQRPNSTSRRIVRKRMGEPSGMEQVIFGQRGG